jgi:hypothetical protein
MFLYVPLTPIKMKKLSILLFLITFISCNQKDQKSEKIPDRETAEIRIDSTTVDTTSSSLGLNSFDEFPEEIDGPGCSFSVDENDYQDGRYLYVDDLDSLAFMKINGRLVRFELVEDKTPYPIENYYSKKFKNEAYDLFIELKKDHDYDEKVFLRGYMLIKPNDGPEEKKDLYGLCGC